MSRTYRLRHLPRVDNSPLKYGDAQYFKTHNEKVKAYLDTVDPDRKLDWRVRWDLEKQYEQEHPAPIGAMWDHPWVGYGVVRSGLKKWYRTTGNRRIRRPLPQLMGKWAHLGDDFEDRLPVRNDGWSTWDLW